LGAATTKILPVLVDPADLQQRADERGEHEGDRDPRRGVEPLVEREADDDPAQRIAEHGRGDAEAHVAGVGDRHVLLRQPHILRLARGGKPRVERIERGVFCYRPLGCVVRVVRHGWRMAPVRRNYGKRTVTGLPFRASAAPLERGSG
jgi:hypothetical protein